LISPKLSFFLQLYFFPAPFPIFFPMISIYFWNFIFSPPPTQFF
jgi:hypothetical protein